MGNPISQTIPAGATGFTAPWAFDWIASPFDVTVTVIVPSGTTAAYSLQYTQDNLNAVPPSAVFTIANANWVNDPTMNAEAATAQVSLNTPYLFGRLNITALSGGPLLIRIVQGIGQNI